MITDFEHSGSVVSLHPSSKLNALSDRRVRGSDLESELKNLDMHMSFMASNAEAALFRVISLQKLATAMKCALESDRSSEGTEPENAFLLCEAALREKSNLLAEAVMNLRSQYRALLPTLGRL